MTGREILYVEIPVSDAHDATRDCAVFSEPCATASTDDEFCLNCTTTAGFPLAGETGKPGEAVIFITAVTLLCGC